MDTGSEQSHLRYPLSQQPAQCILVDLCAPMSADNLNLIAECLHRVLPIVSVLPGPARVPLLGILMANNASGMPEDVSYIIMC